MQLDLLSVVYSLHLNSVFKVGILVLMVGYLIFLIIIARQVSLMNQIFTQTFSGKLLQFIAILLILAMLALLLASLAIL